MDANQQPLSAEITEEQIVAYRQKRLAEAGESIQRILQHHRCTLVAIPRLTADGRIVADVQIKAD